MLREDPAEQREMVSGAGGTKGLFMPSKVPMDLQRSVSASAGGLRPGLDGGGVGGGGNLRNLDELVGEEEVRTQLYCLLPS